MSDECGPPAVEARGLSKRYALWRTPSAPLWAGVFSGLSRAPLLPAGWRRRLRGRADATRTEFVALEGVSFDVLPGESLAVVGRNGSGKSTLLQIVAGTLRPSAGAVRVRGRVAALLELGSGFHPDFTGRENVRLNAALLGLVPDEVEARFADIAAFADVGPFLDQPLRTYSSGMLVRLAFAVAAHADPDLLILDETLAVGDAGFQFKCLERLRRLTARGTALLFVSHDMLTVKAFCRRALYLEAGRCKALGQAAVVAETYFLDLRNEQRRAASAAGALRPRPSLRAGAPPSFGGDEGRILDVRWADGGARAAFAWGESVRVAVELELQDGVAAPWVSLLLLSDRLIPIGGRRARLTAGRGRARWTLRFSFDARLAPGRYFVTARLENGVSPQSALLIDKQTAALEFDVVGDPHAELLGFFDLGIEVEALGPDAARGAERGAADPLAVP